MNNNHFLQKLRSLDEPTLPIIVGRVGSHAYGTNTESSDEDFMAVCFAGPKVYLGLDEWQNKGTFECKVINNDPVDAVAYEFKKFIRLCINFNPNVIPLLWLKPWDYINISYAGWKLLENRKMFLSKECYFPFIGYANSQLAKVQNGLTGKMGQKRKGLRDEFGYDVKFAMHTIRLLRMGIEALKFGDINVYRPDAGELKDIRNGKWSLEKFFEEVGKLTKEAEVAYENSTLPEKVNYDRINEFVVTQLRYHIRLQT